MYKSYAQMLEQAASRINEIMPWEFEDYLSDNPTALLVDVRETYEYEQMRIENAITAPRGILENACLWDFYETIPELASAQHRPILVICRSGYRSVFAAQSMQSLGFEHVTSLKLGIKGLNDENYPIINTNRVEIDADLADICLNPPIQANQRKPKQ
jgi:rhodanese-related sulfurtransferase